MQTCPPVVIMQQVLGAPRGPTWSAHHILR